ncbi:DUF5081 family protein [Terribacillus halophilus]|uniref:DUF5081 family protein n=1 Tax=Terribacillus halophilus TaxID=361279 RepID=UPI00098485E0|nr:DUF5081 family protein [Terribacillus halophilus]
MKESFLATELYLLAASFGASILYGLPDKKVYELQGDEPFRQAHERLIAKGYLTDEGAFTDEGGFVAEVIRQYVHSKKYVQCNHLMFAFGEQDADNLVMLVEKEHGTSYQLFLIEKPLVLQLLTERMPVMSREPLPIEKEFLMKELDRKEREKIEQIGVRDDFLSLDICHKSQEPRSLSNSDFLQSWIVMIEGEKLIMIDCLRKKFYHASQHYFMKIIFDAMDFPYQKKEGA